VDLFVTYYGQSVLYRNQGGGVFTDMTRAAGLAGPERYSTGCAFLDYDRDGRLDLFVSAYLAHEDARRYPPGTPGQNCSWKGLAVMCGPAGLRGAPNVLYRGNADGTFTDVSERAGILKAAPSFGFTPLVLDYDNDGWPDVYVANDSHAALLFHNERDGTFKERGLMAGAALTADGRAQAGMGVAAADYDGDGWLDIAKTNFDDDTTSLYRNLGDGGFEESSARASLGANNRTWAGASAFLTSTSTAGPTCSRSTDTSIPGPIAPAPVTRTRSPSCSTTTSAAAGSRTYRSRPAKASRSGKPRAAPPSATSSTAGAWTSSSTT
jgi:hypothetical protein